MSLFQMAALKDVSRRWHVPPAFSVEFVGYYLERNSRVTSLRRSLERLTKENEKLLSEDELLRVDYDKVSCRYRGIGGKTSYLLIFCKEINIQM